MVIYSKYLHKKVILETRGNHALKQCKRKFLYC